MGVLDDCGNYCVDCCGVGYIVWYDVDGDVEWCVLVCYFGVCCDSEFVGMVC